MVCVRLVGAAVTVVGDGTGLLVVEDGGAVDKSFEVGDALNDGAGDTVGGTGACDAEGADDGSVDESDGKDIDARSLAIQKEASSSKKLSMVD